METSAGALALRPSWPYDGCLAYMSLLMPSSWSATCVHRVRMWIRLTRKLAECLDGIDVSKYKTGDVFELTRAEGELLIAEGWAEPFVRVSERVYQPRKPSAGQHVSEAAAISKEPAWAATRTLDQLREIRRKLEDRYHAQGELRRAEDRIREELRESRAQIIYPVFGSSGQH